MPWKKGQSGCPSSKFVKGDSRIAAGRTKNPFPKMIRLKTKNGKEIVDTVYHVLKHSLSGRLRIHAAEFLRDTGWGKPVQKIDPIGDDGETMFIPITYVAVKTDKHKKTN